MTYLRDIGIAGGLWSYPRNETKVLLGIIPMCTRIPPQWRNFLWTGLREGERLGRYLQATKTGRM